LQVNVCLFYLLVSVSVVAYKLSALSCSTICSLINCYCITTVHRPTCLHLITACNSFTVGPTCTLHWSQ